MLIMESSWPSSGPPTSAGRGPQLLSSSSSPPPPRLSLQSPELQAEFLKERRNKFRSQVDSSDSTGVCSTNSASSLSSPSSPLSSPFTHTPPSSPRSSSASSLHPGCDDRPARPSLSSPELLSELRDSRARSLRHVRAHIGLTTVFSGRGRGQASVSAPTNKPANQRMSH